MEHTTLQPWMTGKQPERKYPTTSDTALSADATAERADRPIAETRTLIFRPHEMLGLSHLDLGPAVETTTESAPLSPDVAATPAEFMRVFAGLERIVSHVGDVSTITGNLMEFDRPYLLGVTSAVAGEGKTTTALHLAMTIARSTPKRVGLIDLSLGHSDLAARFGMKPVTDGLVSAVEDNIDVVPCFSPPGLDNMVVVPAGRVPANPAKFSRLPRVAQFLVATRHAFDIVIVDMPAVTSDNAVPLARQLDGVMMVVRSGVTPREVVSEAIETVGKDVVHSVILNRAKLAAPKWLQRRFGRV